jgi:hypothetical protein
MTLAHLGLKRLRLAAVTAALVVGAPAAHAFTMDTIATPNVGSKYTDPADQYKELGKGKTTTDSDTNGFHFTIGPSEHDRFSSGVRIGPPPDQSKFNDR